MHCVFTPYYGVNCINWNFPIILFAIYDEDRRMNWIRSVLYTEGRVSTRRRRSIFTNYFLQFMWIPVILPYNPIRTDCFPLLLPQCYYSLFHCHLDQPSLQVGLTAISYIITLNSYALCVAPYYGVNCQNWNFPIILFAIYMNYSYLHKNWKYNTLFLYNNNNNAFPFLQ